MERISVFCGSSEGNDEKIVEAARELGRVLSSKGITLVYGGGKVGLMGALADSTLAGHGRVIGVIPHFLKAKEILHGNLDQTIIVESMHQRKLKMHELSQGVIALPGGFGTMEELFEMITWSQLGLHFKPIGLLNTGGFFDPLLVFLDRMESKGFLKPENRNMLLVDDSSTGLLVKMQAYRPQFVPKWIDKEQT